MKYALGVARLALLMCVVISFASPTYLAASRIDNELRSAIKRGSLSVVKGSLERGASPDAIYGDGKTALMYAAERSNFEIVEVLLANSHTINAIDDDNRTALMLAAKEGNKKIVELLLAHGADPKAVDADGKSVSDYAAAAGNREVLQLLASPESDSALQAMAEAIDEASGEPSSESVPFCEAPLWTDSSDEVVTSCAVIDTNLVVVSRESGLAGMRLETGEPLWKLDSVVLRSPESLQLLSEQALALARDGVRYEKRDKRSHSLTRGIRNRLVAFDPLTGNEQWNTDHLGMHSTIGFYPFDRSNLVLVCGRDESDNYWAAAIDVTTGALVWENREFFGNERPGVTEDLHTGPTLDDNQLPLIDTDSSFVTLFDKHALRKWNLHTGQLIWEVDPQLDELPKLSEHYPLMIMSGNHSIIFIPDKKRLHAVSTDDGSPAWQNYTKLKGPVNQMQLLPQGLAVKGEISIPGFVKHVGGIANGGTFVTLLDPRDGHELWSEPCKFDLPGGRSRFLAQDSSLLLYTHGCLNRISLSDGSVKALSDAVPLEGDIGSTLSATEFGYLVTSSQNVIGFDSSGREIFHNWFEKAPPSTLSVFASFMGNVIVSAMVGVVFDQAFEALSGMPVIRGVKPKFPFGQYSYYWYSPAPYPVYLDVFNSRRYGLTTDAANHLYVLTGFPMGSLGSPKPGLAKVDKHTGLALGRLMLDDRTPIYSIDPREQRIVYVEDDRTVACAEF